MSGVLTDLRVVVFFYRLGTICLKLPHTHLLLSFAYCFWCFVFLEHHGTSLIDWPLPIAHPKTKAANACESCEPGAWSSQVRFRTLHLTVCSATFHQRGRKGSRKFPSSSSLKTCQLGSSTSSKSSCSITRIRPDCAESKPKQPDHRSQITARAKMATEEHTKNTKDDQTGQPSRSHLWWGSGCVWGRIPDS